MFHRHNIITRFVVCIYFIDEGNTLLVAENRYSSFLILKIVLTLEV